MHQNKNGIQPIDKNANIANIAFFNPFLIHRPQDRGSVSGKLKAWHLAV